MYHMRKRVATFFVTSFKVITFTRLTLFSKNSSAPTNEELNANDAYNSTGVKPLHNSGTLAKIAASCGNA